jgi:hydrogenase expression/formation protein HypE
MTHLPLGKLPPDLLARLISQAPAYDPRLILGPGIGMDCAVVALEDTCLVFKSDPITFASAEIGWYAVQVNANDIATSGAIPRWFLATLLLPEGVTTSHLVETINQQICAACDSLEISFIGGHTEITHGLDRPIIAGTMIGEVPREKLITPKGISPGNCILLTKGVPIEGTAILGREFPENLAGFFNDDEIQAARDYLHNPGISVVKDARLAIEAGRVTGIHDPTEGGLLGALWEMAEACGQTLVIEPTAVPIPPLARKVCTAFAIDPLRTIASGALLLTTPPEDAAIICSALQDEAIPCVLIGIVESGPPKVYRSTPKGLLLLPRPARDEIARVFERYERRLPT